MSSSDRSVATKTTIWKVKVSARGHMGNLIEDFYDDFKITNHNDGTAEFEGTLADLPEVYGFIFWLRDVMVQLHSLNVTRVEK